ncbi:MAG: hypothetical protein H0X30_36960 [Anaerolineae bacterium]|nr:hypothetical protein [Anaerolineae bacterium]
MNTELARIVQELEVHQPNTRPPLTLEQFQAFEAALECKFPPEISQLYLSHDGHNATDYHPMFLMPSGDALEVYGAIKHREDWWLIYPKLTDNIRYLWHDEDGNYAGAYVAGPLIGKLVFNNHEDPSPAPVFRSITSFYHATHVMLKTRIWGWHEMPTDYPIIAEISPADASSDLEIAQTCIKNWENTSDYIERIGWGSCITALVPPDETIQLIKYLNRTGFDRSKIINLAVKRHLEPSMTELIKTLRQELGTRQNEMLNILVAYPNDNVEAHILSVLSELVQSNKATAILAFRKFGYQIRKTGEDYEYLAPNETTWQKLG